MTEKREGLTARQRYWLECIEECERSGRTLKAYAEEGEMAVTTLYSWKKRLKREGLLAGRRGRFRRVEILEAQWPASEYRIAPQNGVREQAIVKSGLRS